MPARSLSSFLETSPDFTSIEFIDVGIGVVIALLLIDKCVSFTKNLQGRGKNNGKHVTEIAVAEACSNIKEIYRWLNVMDAEGVFRWYASAKVLPMVEDLKHAVEELTHEVRLMNEKWREGK